MNSGVAVGLMIQEVIKRQSFFPIYCSPRLPTFKKKMAATQVNENVFDFAGHYAARKSLPSDPQTRADIEHVLKHGYVILPKCFTSAEAKEARDEIDNLLGVTPLVGRNPFEGLNTNRIYSLLNKTRVFDKFTVLPRVLALNDYFLDESYQLSAFHTISINPGEEPQRLHHDDEYIHLPRPRAPFGTAIMLAFDAYTTTNGATRLIPGSHVWGPASVKQPKESDCISAVCDEGSVVFFVSTLWHGGGKNTSDHVRRSATVQYCQPYLRPIENQILAVDPRKLDQIEPRVVDLMGYKVMQPFVSTFPAHVSGNTANY